MTTAQLLLNQVKSTLDKTLLDKNLFEPQLEKENLEEVTSDVIEMLKMNAGVRKIELEFSIATSLCDRLVFIDKLRVQ